MLLFFWRRHGGEIGAWAIVAGLFTRTPALAGTLCVCVTHSCTTMTFLLNNRRAFHMPNRSLFLMSLLSNCGLDVTRDAVQRAPQIQLKSAYYSVHAIPPMNPDTRP